MKGNPKHHPKALSPKMREVVNLLVEHFGPVGHTYVKRKDLRLVISGWLNREDRPSLPGIPRWITRNFDVRTARGHYDLSVLAKLPDQEKESEAEKQ
jgi:hypothetical protein